jgi:hypothetical protein
VILPLITRIVAKMKRMTYGGVLSEVGVRNRDGSTGCPVCQKNVPDRRHDVSMVASDEGDQYPERSLGFEPLSPQGVVTCMSCRTVFLQRRSASLLDKKMFVQSVSESQDGSKRPDPRNNIHY